MKGYGIQPTMVAFLAVLAAGASVSACGPARPSGAAPQPPPAAPMSTTATGYLAPPGLEGAERGAGGLTLTGHAPAGSQVRLASPEGQTLSIVASRDGAWSLSLPAPSGPALFALSAQTGARVVRGEGAVVLLPEPGPPALMARAGFAALPLVAGAPVPVISTLDYDAGGGAAVAGFAVPRARVRLNLDGAAAGLGQADETGRFAVIAANRPLHAGARTLEVETDTGRAEVRVEVSSPAPLGQSAYRTARQPGAWRIDWAPAGGGVQTTVVFDNPVRPSPRPAS